MAQKQLCRIPEGIELNREHEVKRFLQKQLGEKPDLFEARLTKSLNWEVSWRCKDQYRCFRINSKAVIELL